MREALKLALEALTYLLKPMAKGWDAETQTHKRDAAITAIKQALAAPVQEPVACKHEWFRTGAMEPEECRCIKCGVWNNTTPPAAQRQWVGLTDEEIEECWDGYLSDYQLQMIREMVAKLKEKNT